MTIYIKVLIILIATIFLFGCADEKPNSNISDNNNYIRSIDSLKKYINLEKYKPINVMWKITKQGESNNSREIVPGPTDYILEAFIQFDRQTADRLKNDYKHDVLNNEVFSTNNFWFKWLPNDMLIKEKLDSSRVFNINPFAKSPLLNGEYVFISVNAILLCLYTT